MSNNISFCISQVIPEPGSLIGDLLSMDLGAPAPAGTAGVGGNVDLLGGGLDDLVGLGGGAGTAPAPKPVRTPSPIFRVSLKK